MTKEEMQKLSERIYNNTATEDEKSLFFDTINKLIAELKDELTK